MKSLLEQEGRDDLALRISVQPGGCSGLRYQLFFDERTLDGDVVTDFDGVAVVVDRMSVPYLNGAMIDFVDTSRSRASRSTTPTPPAPAPAATRSTESDPEHQRQAPAVGGGFRRLPDRLSVQVQVQRVRRAAAAASVTWISRLGRSRG